jgi:hypothetical protein
MKTIKDLTVGLRRHSQQQYDWLQIHNNGNRQTSFLHSRFDHAWIFILDLSNFIIFWKLPFTTPLARHDFVKIKTLQAFPYIIMIAIFKPDPLRMDFGHEPFNCCKAPDSLLRGSFWRWPIWYGKTMKHPADVEILLEYNGLLIALTF